MSRFGSLCVALGLVTGAGCTPRAEGEREIEVKEVDQLAEARTILQRYANGQPMSSEAMSFPKLVEDVKAKDAKKGEILEKGLDELQKAPASARQAKAKELLKKRDLARKGLSEHPDEGKNALKEQQKREEKIADAGLAVGLGLKRSG